MENFTAMKSQYDDICIRNRDWSKIIKIVKQMSTINTSAYNYFSKFKKKMY